MAEEIALVMLHDGRKEDCVVESASTGRRIRGEISLHTTHTDAHTCKHGTDLRKPRHLELNNAYATGQAKGQPKSRDFGAAGYEKREVWECAQLGRIC